MKGSIRQTCFLVLLFLKIARSQNDSTTEPVSELPNTCPESCPWSRGHVKTEVTSDWCSGVDFTEPPFHVRLPKCMTVTLKKVDFFIGEDYKLVLKKDKFGEKHADFQLSEDNQTANICYPLSPQLQNCKLKQLDQRMYAHNDSLLALQNCKSKELIALGDFYVIPGNKSIIACDDSLEQTASRYKLGLPSRCQYLDLGVTNYELLDESTTIRMLPSNRTIKQAVYERTGNSSNIRMCFPLNARMITCPRYIFYPYEYTQETDYGISILRNYRFFGLGDYQINSSTRDVEVCKYQDQSMMSPTFLYYCHIVQLVSAALIVLAIILHLIFPSINYHAKPLLSQMISMAAYNIAAPYRYMWYPETKIGCYVTFGFCYFSVLTSFFWLNVLSFDLWSIFASLQTSAARLCDKRPKFLLYCTYSYPIPAIMAIMVIVLETQPSMQVALGIRPDILANCWFNENKSLYIFYFGPGFFLLCINMIFFGLTVCNLRRASEGTKIVNKNRNKQLFLVCVKICVILGLCWNIQFIATLTGVKTMKYIAFIAISIQGILLFIIYICKPSTYRLLKKKLTAMKSTTNSKMTNRSNQNSSSGVSMESVLDDDNTIKAVSA